jgi:hypothetical protein
MKITLVSIATILVFASSLCVEAAPIHHTERAGHSNVEPAPSHHTEHADFGDIEPRPSHHTEDTGSGDVENASSHNTEHAGFGKDAQCEKDEQCPHGHVCMFSPIQNRGVCINFLFAVPH